MAADSAQAQWGLLVKVRGIDTGVSIEQQSNARFVAAPDSVVQCGPSIVIHGVDVSVSIEQ